MGWICLFLLALGHACSFWGSPWSLCPDAEQKLGCPLLAQVPAFPDSCHCSSFTTALSRLSLSLQEGPHMVTPIYLSAACFIFLPSGP